jgi:rubredoxin
MTYQYYHQVKGGKSPKTAPTYAGSGSDTATLQKKTRSTQKYKCKICGYVYDPAEGDPDAKITAGTAFEELPDSWVCPTCGAPKTEFEEVG